MAGKTEEEMRIVIVEDEASTRQGLVSIIQNYTHHDIVGTASSGAEGLEMIRKEQPDVIISDIKMPGMNGLEMLQKVKDENLEMRVILLSGYSEFEFARKALQLQVIEYLLKPLQVNELLDALNRIEESREEESLKKVSLQQLFWSCFTADDTSAKKMIPLLMKELRITEEMTSDIFFIHPVSIVRESEEELIELMSRQLEILCFENYFIFRMPQTLEFLVIMVDTESKKSLRNIFEMRVLQKMNEVTECLCSMVYITGLQDFRNKIVCLQKLISYAFSIKQGIVIYDGLAKETVYTETDYPLSLELDIVREIRNGNSEKIRACGKQFEADVIFGSNSPLEIREKTTRFVNAVLRTAEDIRKNFAVDSDSKYIMNIIASSSTSRQLAYQFDKIIDAASDLHEENPMTQNGIILNAIAYIKDHYSSDITLGETAEKCGVSAEYLSRLFFQETGTNFSAFLQDIRISMAKRLLNSGNNKVYEVAEMVGFHDQKYFAKIFKKLCGETPAEYRKENG